MARRDTPEPWKTLMERRGIGSLRHLARLADLSPATLSRAVHGDSVPNDETVSAVADALGIGLPDTYTLFGGESPDAAPYVPPAEANRLTARQRRAIDEMIRAITAGREDQDDATQAEDEAGRGQGVPGAGDRTPINLADVRRVKDDPAAFGDQARRGDLDQGKLQPPPPAERSAAYEPREGSEGVRGAQESSDRGEESQG